MRTDWLSEAEQAAGEQAAEILNVNFDPPWYSGADWGEISTPPEPDIAMAVQSIAEALGRVVVLLEEILERANDQRG